MTDNISRDEFLKLTVMGFGTSVIPFSSFGSLRGPRYTISPYSIPKNVKTLWTSPENRGGKKGAGANENRGAEGHAFDEIKAGETYDLLNVEGTGMVNRIKMTIKNRSPLMLRSLRKNMFWDSATRPAVSAPLIPQLLNCRICHRFSYALRKLKI